MKIGPQNNGRRLLLLLVLASLLAMYLVGVSAWAQSSSGSYRITSSVTAGGGGASTGSGNLTLEGTAGQPGAGGPFSNSPLSFRSGFWPTTLASPLVSGPSNLQLNATSYSVNEGCATAVVAVNRSGGNAATATVDFATSDNTAEQRTDYTIASGTVSFAPGETVKSFSVLISKDAYTEGPETINLTLSNPSSSAGASLGAPSTATLTINNDGSVPVNTQPIDEAGLFVCQHYHDFLAREPDSSGAAFWTGQITQCGNDALCIRNKRNDVSNAFYFELEFQQTGAYVYRLYRAAYGNNQPFPNPDNSNQNEAKKLPSYPVFARDRARVVGGADLAQGQLDLANAFVQRNEFLTKYPASLSTAAQFVDAVLATISNDTGVDLTSQ